MSQPVVQVCKLIRPSKDSGAVGAEEVVVSEFEDLKVVHPLNDGRTCRVTLSIHDPVVAGLTPFAFAVRVLWEDRLEPVFFGPSNISVDYAAEKCFLDAQDPSLRMSHHYIRRGDSALTGDSDPDKGTINADSGGIDLCIEAAQNIATQDARDDPSLGLRSGFFSPARTRPIGVERFQECWFVVQDISKAVGGPDFDMQTVDYWPADVYSFMNTYLDLGTDRTSLTPDAPAAGEVVLDFGLGADNLSSFQERPGRPTTHCHVHSGDGKYRRTAGATGGSNQTGVFVDAINFDVEVKDGDTEALLEVAQARVLGYGFPPRFLEVTLRPDAVVAHSYGHPSFTVPLGTRAPTVYLGDKVTVRALRGERSYSGDARITAARYIHPGKRGPASVQLTLVPVIAGDTLDGEA